MIIETKVVYFIVEPDGWDPIVYFDPYAIGDVLKATWLRWRFGQATELPGEFAPPAVQIGEFVGKRNRKGGWDGCITANSVEYEVRDTVIKL
ncbi:hypothetical protein J2T17_004680 [Paenibacillus mucilaginosus]|uniref:hypothetical protein n=1 Tax=Paenibacillus mucilaginosus TaxID=61624 RepID=UPI003D2188F9